FFTQRQQRSARLFDGATNGSRNTIYRHCACSARLASQLTQRHGCGIIGPSAEGVVRSWTHGGKPNPAQFRQSPAAQRCHSLEWMRLLLMREDVKLARTWAAS